MNTSKKSEHTLEQYLLISIKIRKYFYNTNRIDNPENPIRGSACTVDAVCNFTLALCIFRCQCMWAIVALHQACATWPIAT